MTDDNSNNNSSKIYIIGATIMLLISIGINGALFMRLKETRTIIKDDKELFGEVIANVGKEASDIVKTLAECNATLAAVQAKPTPVPLACPPVLPMPVCPSVPTVTCPAAPEPSPAVVAPAPIATPVPKIIYRYKYIHRHIHYRKPAKAAEPICDWFNPKP